MKVVLYDGYDTIGGNKIYVQEGANGIFLDFGHNFAKYGKYFSEFLTERSTRGIHDAWRLKLIPELNIYREDLIPEDIKPEIMSLKSIPINAILITHAHMDHAGGIGLLREDIPIVASPMTMAILKAMRDVKNLKLGLEVPYHNPRFSHKDDARILKAPSNSKKEEHMYRSRKVILTEDSEFVRSFIFKKFRSKGIKKNSLTLLEDVDLGFEIIGIPVSHSIPGAMGYIIKGDVSIAYTGDFRFHGRDGNNTWKFFEKAKKEGVRALIIEGTRVSRENDVQVSEKEVHENVLRIAEDASGLIVASFPEKDIDRFETFLDVSKRTSRELVIMPDHAFLLYAIGSVMRRNFLNYVRIIDVPKDNRGKWEKEFLRVEFSEKYVEIEEIRKEPSNYFLCLSFYDFTCLLDINPQGGTYIYSASEAHEEEDVFDFLRLWNWLKHFKFDVYGFKVMGENHVEFDKGLHASGHASGEEIVKVIDYVDPDYVIPVHTNDREWFVEKFGNKVVLDEEVML